MINNIYMFGGMLYVTMSYYFSNYNIDLYLNFKIFSILCILSILLLTVYYDIQVMKLNRLKRKKIEENQKKIEENRERDNNNLHYRKNDKKSIDDNNIKYKIYKPVKNLKYKKKRPSKIKLFDCYDVLDEENFFGQWINIEE
jgi:hypothetical protein